jgi:uncharacterized membrane protein
MKKHIIIFSILLFLVFGTITSIVITGGHLTDGCIEMACRYIKNNITRRCNVGFANVTNTCFDMNVECPDDVGAPCYRYYDDLCPRINSCTNTKYAIIVPSLVFVSIILVMLTCIHGIYIYLFINKKRKYEEITNL